MEKMTCDTFLDFRLVSDPALSPDGQHVAFVLHTPNVQSNGYDGAVCVCDLQGGSKQLTRLGNVKSFTWLDNETLLFPAMRSASKKDPVYATSYYTLSLHGGEAQERFTVSAKCGKAMPAGDGRYLLTCSWDNRCPSPEGMSPQEYAAAQKMYAERGYETFEEIPFWSNGVGITDRKRNRLCLYDEKNDVFTYLTAPMFKVGGFTAKDGKVLYIGTTFDAQQSLKNGVFLYDIARSVTTCLLEQGRYLVKLFDLYKNKAVLCLTDGEGYGNGENGSFYTIDLETGKMNLLHEHNHHCIGSTVGTDSKLGAGASWKVMEDRLYYITTVDQYSYIDALDLVCGGTERLTGPGAVEFLDADAGKLVYLAFKEDRIGELYTLENRTERRLTHYNDAISERYVLSTPAYLECQTGAELPIQSWVIRPIDYEPEKKYPAILTIHGGPRLTYGTSFTHEMQLWAANGYFVIYCNPRGSEGRGNPFADIRGRFGTIDYEDIMAVLDNALAHYPDIDPNRLGVGGGSYGGFMTNWIIGHTDRFKAACSQRSIANWTGFEGTADIGYYFSKGQTGASHTVDHALQWKQSPLKYLDKAVTPTLFLHGDEDYRCWQLEAYQMFASLKLHGVPARLCLFQGENHELSRSGRPKQRIKRLEEMLAWYDRYLKPFQEKGV